MIVIIMGVSGCGKSTIGKKLAQKLGCSFLEGDDFHPTENITKMKKGIPLTDQDRLPWLNKISEKCTQENDIGNNVVVAGDFFSSCKLHNTRRYQWNTYGFFSKINTTITNF